MDDNKAILAPIITEKSMKEVKSNKFTFKVNLHADKKNIKKAIEEKFDVDVLSVSTLIVKGRSLKVGKKRSKILKSPWKKAVVKIKEGQKIALFEAGEKK